LTCSLPVDRKTFVHGSFISSWVFSSSMLIVAILTVLLKSYLSPIEGIYLLEVLQLKVLILSLWIPTLMFLLFFTLYTWKNAGVAMTTFLAASFFGISTIIVNLITSADKLPGNQDPMLVAFLKSSLMSFISHHGTTTGLIFSVILLVLVNLWTVKFSELLFRCNNIVT